MKTNEQPFGDQDIKHIKHTNGHLMGVTSVEERKMKKIIANEATDKELISKIQAAHAAQF